MTPEELELLRRYLASQPNLGPTATTALTPYQQIMSRMTPTANPYMQQPTVTGGYNPELFSRNTGASGLLNTPYAPPVNDRSGSRERNPADQARINAFMDAEDAKDIANGDPVGTTRGARITNDLGFLKNFIPGMGLVSLFSKQDENASPTIGLLDRLMSPFTGLNTETGGYRTGFNQDALGTGVSTQSQPDSNPANNAATEAAAQANAANTVNVNDAAANAAADSARAYAAAVAEGMRSDSSSNADGYGGFGRGGENYTGGGGYAMGGMVNNLFGPNPPGPDDGTGYLQRGEYVIKKSAVDKMPKGLLDMINSGKMPMKKSKSLIK